MRYARLAALILVACAMGAMAAPARAEEMSPPALAPLNSVRDSAVLLFNDRPLQVCQREWQSWNRVHGVCRDLATATVYDRRLIAGTTVEFVLFDGVRYERVNDEAAWTSGPDPEFAPDVSLGEALFRTDGESSVTLVDPTEVAGVAATHYQLWSTDDESNEAAGGQVVYDQFVSGAGFVLKAHHSVRGAVPGLGEGALVEVRTFSDFNGPVTIAPPV
jgi:hypothetical protein